MDSGVDASKYPRLAAYLSGLPRGIDAYPEVEAKAALITNALEFRRPYLEKGTVPAPIVELVDASLPVSVWVPEVHFQAVMLLIADAYFPGDDDGFVTWVYQISRRLYAKPLYRALMYVVSAERVVRGAAARWGNFHRGVRLLTVEQSSDGATLDLMYPPGLYTELHVRLVAAAFRAGVEAAGGKNVIWAASRYTRTRSLLVGSWEP